MDVLYVEIVSTHTQGRIIQPVQPIKWQMHKGWHYDVEMKEWMEKVVIMMCKLKRGMDKGGHYDVEMKGWMQKGGILRCK